MNDWPSPYLPAGDPTGSPSAPTWSRMRAIDAGIAVARLTSTDPAYAKAYLQFIKSYGRKGEDRTDAYAALVARAYKNPDTTDFNANDLANVHRAAFLSAVRAFDRLVGESIYVELGDPPLGRTARKAELATSHDKFVFSVPNATGYYAVTAADFHEAEADG